MLIRFSVTNFLSIREKQEVFLISSGIKELRETNTIDTSFSNLTLLRSLGIFGPNSSGKSNIFKSLAFVKKFVIESSTSKQSNQEISVRPFLLHKDCIDLPSSFEIEFLLKEIWYRYKLVVNKERVVEEALFYKKKKKEFLLFQRNYNEFEIGNKLRGTETLFQLTRHNASFLSVISQFNFPIGMEIIGWFNQIKFLKDELNTSLLQQTARLFNNSKYSGIIGRILKNADLGFDQIKTSDEPDIMRFKELMALNQIFKGEDFHTFISRLNIRSIHKVYDKEGSVIGHQEFDISVESLGTQKFFSMIGRIAEVLIEGGILVVDEIDARLHSFLSESIIQYFNSSVNNPNNSQLIFISHNSYLMRNKLLRRDQIYLTEKDSFESTTLGTLMDQKIRYDVNFEKVYLEKKVTGTPTINSQLNLFEKL